MFEVCVVGGGLAGLACALSLANAFSEDNEISITLIELRNFQSKGATLGLALNGQAAMKEISPTLLEKLKKVGIPLETGAYMLPWYRIRDGLLEEVQRHSEKIKLFTNTKVVSISQSDEDSKVTIETVQHSDDDDDDDNAAEDSYDATATKTSLTADCVIGADGLHSTIRNFLPEAQKPISSKAVCWRGFLETVPVEIEHMLTDIKVTKMIMKDQWTLLIFNYHSVTPGMLCWTISSKDMNAKSALECLDTFCDDPKEQDDIRIMLESSSYSHASLNHRTELGIVPLLNNKWGGLGRITLIGDAAHAIRPAGGLGGSLAFEDVVILTRELVKVHKSNRNNKIDVNLALREYEKIRFPRCQTIQDDQNRISEASYKSEEERNKLEWHPNYKDWVYFGPDATSNPPLPLYKHNDEVNNMILNKKSYA